MRWHPLTRREVVTLLVLALLIAALPPALGQSRYLLDIVTLVIIWAMAASAWNLIGGYQNQFALGHSVFFAAGAYISMLFYLRFGISPWIGMWPGVVVGAAVSAFIAWICLRLKGAFYALATFALSQVVQILLVIWVPITNGAEGLAIPYSPSFGNMIFASDAEYVYLYGAVLLVFIGLTYWLEKTRWGLSSRALSQDEDAASALGVRTLRVKVLGAALSGGLTAIAGVAYAQYLLFIDPPDVAGVQFSIEVSLIAVFGGVATGLGPVVGAAVLIPVSSFLTATLGTGAMASQAPGLTLIVYGTILTATLLYMPEGIYPRFLRVLRSGLGSPRQPGRPAPLSAHGEE
jgi:branched-chain amino acid transport system permease protein